jgi:hypothetical protein
MAIRKAQVVAYQEWLATRYCATSDELSAWPADTTDLTVAQVIIVQRLRARLDAYHNALRNYERAFALAPIVTF